MTGRPALYGALDLGGTKVCALVADLQGQVYGEDIRPSHTVEGLEAVLTRMVESLVAARQRMPCNLDTFAVTRFARANSTRKLFLKESRRDSGNRLKFSLD